jgi:hypothetical protein
MRGQVLVCSGCCSRHQAALRDPRLWATLKMKGWYDEPNSFRVRGLETASGVADYYAVLALRKTNTQR